MRAKEDEDALEDGLLATPTNANAAAATTATQRTPQTHHCQPSSPRGDATSASGLQSRDARFSCERSAVVDAMLFEAPSSTWTLTPSRCDAARAWDNSASLHNGASRSPGR